MEAQEIHDHWKDIGGGIRPSVVLIASSVLILACPLLALVPALKSEAWVAWVLALLLLGVALIVSGIRPWLSWVALVPGGIAVVQSVGLAFTLIGMTQFAGIYAFLSLPRALSILALALVERKNIAPHRRLVLALAGGLSALKIVLDPVLAIPPKWVPVLDAAVLVVLAVALFMLAQGLRHREREWASRRFADSNASFSDFNPPTETSDEMGS